MAQDNACGVVKCEIKSLIFSSSKAKKTQIFLKKTDSISKIKPSKLLPNPLNSTGSSVTFYRHLN